MKIRSRCGFASATSRKIGRCGSRFFHATPASSRLCFSFLLSPSRLAALNKKCPSAEALVVSFRPQERPEGRPWGSSNADIPSPAPARSEGRARTRPRQARFARTYRDRFRKGETPVAPASLPRIRATSPARRRPGRACHEGALRVDRAALAGRSALSLSATGRRFAQNSAMRVTPLTEQCACGRQSSGRQGFFAQPTDESSRACSPASAHIAAGHARAWLTRCYADAFGSERAAAASIISAAMRTTPVTSQRKASSGISFTMRAATRTAGMPPSARPSATVGDRRPA